MINVEPYLRRIRKEFPALHFKNVRIPCQGVDHVALILDEQWVFRFPKKQRYKFLFPKEVALLSALHRLLPLPIPHYHHVSHDRSFGGYALIPGKSLTKRLYTRMSPASKKHIHRQLADFLSALHAVPLHLTQKYGVETLSLRRKFTRKQREYLRYARPILNAQERREVDLYFAEMRTHVNDPFTPVFTHHDLHLDHILVNEKNTGVAGIIDFGDRGIGDPALDFTLLWLYGPRCAKAVVEGYAGKKDAAFLERSRLYYKQYVLTGVALAVRGMILTEKQAMADFRAVFMK